MSKRTKIIGSGLILFLVISIVAWVQLQNSATQNPLEQPANRLIHATSPYLLQHAHNPVDWYEWGEEALAKAKNEDKPILISIGYSSCHWCHVMERESFENEEIARIMNENFICIKVDREERPDVDQVYMEALQAMGINGGWPLNMFLTPDQKPFYGGTYFSPESWKEVLKQINESYKTKRGEIEASADELHKLLSQSNELENYVQSTEETELANDLEEIYSKFQPQFDRVYGGLGDAPKFVNPSNWLFLMRYYHLTGNQEALDQVMLSLKRMAMGGIHDQIGGGFSRYAVDKKWFVPHFEKMLYDNAQLMSLYAEGYALTRDPEFKSLIEEMFQWLRREMMHPEGGFYSSVDADSEGEEGNFYIWKLSELNEVLGEDAEIIAEYFSVKEEGNWEQGKNILIREKEDSLFLAEQHLSSGSWDKRLQQAKSKLLAARNKRIRPGVDDKVITAWNAMMISGLTHAYRALGDKSYLQIAEKSMLFIEKKLTDKQALFRSYKGKPSSAPAFLDDYAFVIQAYIDLYQVTFDEQYIRKAKRLLSFTMEQFFDKNEGFFFYTSHEGEALISRKKEVFDNEMPSSNSVMARNLYYLGIIFDDQSWKQLANEMTQSMVGLIKSEPAFMANWAIGYMETKISMAEVVFYGPGIQEFRKEFQQQFHPFSVSMGTTGKSSLPLLKGKEAIDGKATIFVCFNKTCKWPVHSVSEAVKQLPATLKSRKLAL